MKFLIPILIAAFAHAQPFKGLDCEVLRTTATDGAELSLLHLAAPRAGAPVVLLEPGLLENAAMFEGAARAFHDRGYEVYIGQVRFAGRRENRSGHGDSDGLEEVLLQDFPAHFRAVIARHPGVKIDLVGHSMGGMEILASLSDGRLEGELAPHAKAVTLIAAPTNLHDIPLWLHLECKMMMPVFKMLVKVTGPLVSTHTTVFEFMERARASSNPLVAASVGQLEKWLINFGSFLINKQILSADRMSPEAKRRFWSEEVAAFPMELLLDFARAAASREFLSHDGLPLMAPERIKVPVEVIRAMRDRFAAPEGQQELFEHLGSRVKRLIDLTSMRHVDPLVVDQPGSDFITAALDFHDNPVGATKKAPRLTFKGASPLQMCESYLRSADLSL